MRLLTKLALTIAVVAMFTLGTNAEAQLFWRTDGTSGTWTGTNWNPGAPNPTGGAGWTPGSNADFSALSSVTYVTGTSIGDVIVENGVSVTVGAAGTQSAGTHDYNVGTGSTLTWTGQGVSTAGASNFTKDGLGIWNIGAQGNLYSGSFTLNAGTVIVSGNNSFGGGASLLTINGGTIQSSGTRAFAPTALIIGGDFAITGTGNPSWVGTVALGSAIRTITNNSSGIGAGTTFSGVISSGAGGGLGFSGNGITSLTNTNTYSGGTLINAGTLIITKDGGLGTGNVSLTAGGVTLTLGGGVTQDYINDGASLSILSGDTVNLNYTVALPDTVASLVVNGVAVAPGLYGSTGINPNGIFTGTGLLLVVPEPSVYMLLGVGLLFCGQRFLRRRNA